MAEVPNFSSTKSLSNIFMWILLYALSKSNANEDFTVIMLFSIDLYLHITLSSVELMMFWMRNNKLGLFYFCCS